VSICAGGNYRWVGFNCSSKPAMLGIEFAAAQFANKVMRRDIELVRYDMPTTKDTAQYARGSSNKTKSAGRGCGS
jgi:hypothetical protein